MVAVHCTLTVCTSLHGVRQDDVYIDSTRVDVSRILFGRDSLWFDSRKRPTRVIDHQPLFGFRVVRFTYSDSDPVTHKPVKEAKCKSRFLRIS